MILSAVLSALILLSKNGEADGFRLPIKAYQSRRSNNGHYFTTSPSTSTSLHTTKIGTYQYKDWNLTYRYNTSKSNQQQKKPNQWGLPSLQRLQQNVPDENSPLLLIHPVGIGIDSWFWKKVMNEWNGDTYAPDLIGCGVKNGGDAWNPTEQPLSFPLGWVQGIEPLLSKMGGSGCTVVVQGGLAPVGVLLAARNPSLVTNLILCSPPTYPDMTTAVPSHELERNFQFLTNPMTATPAFSVLESEWALRFFSSAFLFSNDCDDEWVHTALATVSPKSRTPVAAFNAGLCQHRSLKEELTMGITQPTLVLSGEDDKRDRQPYVDFMKNCKWQRLSNCCNVLPWEDPQQFCQALREFV